MKIASKDYIIQTVFRTNILPVISECNTSCIFCSHKYNPDGVEVFRLPKLTIEDFEEIISYISPNKKIIIGEAATRIVEGEPLLYGKIVELLKLTREKFPQTPIQLTTNGIELNEHLLDSLIQIGQIELNISINCVDPSKRAKILGPRAQNDIKSKIRMLKGRVKFTGSMVYIPELLGERDMEDMISLLSENGADSVRIFLPGYTSRAEKAYDLREMHKITGKLVEKLRHKYPIPVVIEPSIMKNLQCRIEGVIAGTPAYHGGLRIDDVILKINGTSVKTRVDGFDRAYKLTNPRLTVRRGEQVIDLSLQKTKNSTPGFVVLFDMDPEMKKLINTAVKRHKASDVLFISSELAGDLLKEFFEQCEFEFKYRILMAENEFFGGTIKCAGLLTAQDIINSGQKFLYHNERPQLVLLPSIMFDYKKTDLLGRSIKEVEEGLGVPVDII